jgi:hypothetical protein
MRHVSVKDMRAIAVNHYARSPVALGMAIPGDVIAFLDDQARQPRFCKFTGNDSATETRTNNGYPLHPDFQELRAALMQPLVARRCKIF